MTVISKLLLTGEVSLDIQPGKMGANSGGNSKGESFGFTNYYMTKNGEPFIPVVGEFHFSRFSYLHWEEELLKMKAGGVHIVATYIFWNFHEEEEGVFDWSGNRNLRHFIDLCAKHDYPLILRIGPFCHGEVRNGGIPDWVFAKPIEIRSNDPGYLVLARRLYREIAMQMKGSLFQEGGPVIAVQLENEFMHCGAPNDAWGYKAGKFLSSGTGGNLHLAELRRIAEDAGIRPLFFTVTAWGGAAIPEEGFLPMLAGYAYTSWIPNQPPSGEFLYRDLRILPAEPVNFDARDYPVAYCEMAGGMQVSYNARPSVPADSIEAMTLVKLASGSNLLGYYMYHGGSNPVGKRSFLNEQYLPKITYDYQSPLGEFGRVGESYHRIRSLSLFLESFGSVLAPMATVLPAGQSELKPEDTETLRWSVRHKEGSGFIFLNNFQDQVDMPDRPFRIELETAQGVVSVPKSGEAILPGGAGVVLPFQLNLHGVSLISATAQLLTEVQQADEHVVVFYAHTGLEPEYVLLKSSISHMNPGDSTVTDHEEMVVIQPAVGKEHHILINTAGGQKVRLLTLTRKEALNTYRFDLWGQKTLVISESSMVVHNHRLICTSPGQSRISVSLYPAPEAGLLTDSGELKLAGEEGLFRTFEISLPDCQAQMSIIKPSDKSALLQFSGDWPSYVENVWLEVDYDGDVAEAYLNNQLLTDHIHFGKTWSIGLKDFANQLEHADLHLQITPLRQGTVHTFINQAQVERFEGIEIAVFHRIEAIPHYQVKLTPAR